MGVGSKGVGQTRLELTSGDELVAVSRDKTWPLLKTNDIINDVNYVTNLDHAEAGSEVQVSFHRQDGLNAPDSFVLIPPPFVIESPTSKESIGWDQTFSLKWTAAASAGEDMKATVEIECQQDSGKKTHRCKDFTFADNGSYEMNIASLFDNQEISELNGCEANLKLTRKEIGTLDANFGEGGFIYGRQIRSIKFAVDLPQP